jgi:hypothetical protein
MARRFSITRTSAGFSFVEMAVAIVLLGIAMVLTMRGAAMVDFFRAFVTANRLQQIQHNVFVYSATYNAIPGDDPTAPYRYKREPAIFITDGRAVVTSDNSVIDGKLSDFANITGEHLMAWRDLRYAKLIDGDPKVIGFASLPENPFGGIYGFDGGNLGQKNGSICATKIPGAAAQAIDERLDDGRINGGKVVGTAKFAMDVYNNFAAPDTEPYNVEKEYIICVPLLP